MITERSHPYVSSAHLSALLLCSTLLNISIGSTYALPNPMQLVVFQSHAIVGESKYMTIQSANHWLCKFDRFANKSIFLSRNASIKKNANFQCHRDKNCLFWSWAIVPIWTNLISTFDAWSYARLDLQVGFAGRIHGTKFCISGLNVCEKWMKHVTCTHGLKLALLNNENLFATSWGSPEERWIRRTCIGNLLEEDLLDVQQWIGQANWNNFLE